MPVQHVHQFLFDIRNVLVDICFVFELDSIANTPAIGSYRIDNRIRNNNKCFYVLLPNIGNLNLHGVQLD